MSYLSIFYVHPDYTREYSVLPHIIPANTIPCPSLFPRIIFLSHIIRGNILFYISIFHLHPDYTMEYSVLPHIIPANIIPSPRLSTRIFRLSSVYSIFTQITQANFLSYPKIFVQILFIIQDYRREYSDSAQFILTSPKLN